MEGRLGSVELKRKDRSGGEGWRREREELPLRERLSKAPQVMFTSTSSGFRTRFCGGSGITHVFGGVVRCRLHSRRYCELSRPVHLHFATCGIGAIRGDKSGELLPNQLT